MRYLQGTAVLTKSEHSAEGRLTITLEISKSGLKKGRVNYMQGLKKKGGLTRGMVSHQGALLSGWSLTRVLCCQCGLSPGCSVVRVVSY